MSHEMMSFLPLIVVFIIFYIFVIRPQHKKTKEHQTMLQTLRKGDKIVTSCGLMGVIYKVVDDNEVLLEIAESVRVRVLRSGIVAKN